MPLLMRRMFPFIKRRGEKSLADLQGAQEWHGHLARGTPGGGHLASGTRGDGHLARGIRGHGLEARATTKITDR
jgi:hypothetical protein